MDRWEKHKSDWPAKNPHNLKIDVFNRQKDLPLKSRSVQRLVSTLLKFLNVSCEEISLYFVTEKKISALHAEFFQDPAPTDCISFPLDDKHLGEIFVCPSIAQKYAVKKNLDPYEETTLYIVHGILHLLGFDDLEREEKRVMRKKEKSCMRHLKELGICIQ